MMSFRSVIAVIITGVVAVGLWIALRDRRGAEVSASSMAAAGPVGLVGAADEPGKSVDEAGQVDPRLAVGSAHGATLIAASRPVNSAGARDSGNAGNVQPGVEGRGDAVLAADAAVPAEAQPVDAAETADATRQVPRAWFRTDDNDGYTFLTDHQTVHTGASSAVLRGTDAQADSMTAVFQSCRATDFRGLRARFSIFVFGPGIAEIWMRVDDPSSDAKPIDVVRVAAPIPSPTAWAPVSATMSVSSTAAALTYGVILHGSGPLWMDTAGLAVLAADGGAREEPSVDPSSRVWADAGSVPGYPWNLDFEEFTAPP